MVISRPNYQMMEVKLMKLKKFYDKNHKGASRELSLTTKNKI